jgi:hypothetical protein
MLIIMPTMRFTSSLEVSQFLPSVMSPESFFTRHKLIKSDILSTCFPLFSSSSSSSSSVFFCLPLGFYKCQQTIIFYDHPRLFSRLSTIILRSSTIIFMIVYDYF